MKTCDLFHRAAMNNVKILMMVQLIIQYSSLLVNFCKAALRAAVCVRSSFTLIWQVSDIRLKIHLDFMTSPDPSSTLQSHLSICNKVSNVINPHRWHCALWPWLIHTNRTRTESRTGPRKLAWGEVLIL